jgi:hypothetical protein
MKNRALVRKLMMVAGLMAALTILFSSTAKYQPVRAIGEVSASEDVKDDAKLVAVSADAVTSSQAVEVESVNPYVVQEIITEPERPTSTNVRLLVIPVLLITSLLKVVISPQAP